MRKIKCTGLIYVSDVIIQIQKVMKGGVNIEGSINPCDAFLSVGYSVCFRSSLEMQILRT